MVVRLPQLDGGTTTTTTTGSSGPPGKRPTRRCSRTLWSLDATTAASSSQIVSSWCQGLQNERAVTLRAGSSSQNQDEGRKHWSSVALWAETLLREQEHDVGASYPNKRRSVTLIMVLRELCRVFSRYAPVLQLVTREVIGCTYAQDGDDEALEWTSDDLYARSTWFERCQVLKSKIDTFKGELEDEHETQKTLDSFKKSLGAGFKCMLDPSTRVLRRAMFLAWARLVHQQNLKRAQIVARGTWRLDHELKRRCFAALNTHVRVSLREKLLKERRQHARGEFSTFKIADRRDAATVINTLLHQATDRNHPCVAVLKHAARLALAGSDAVSPLPVDAALDKQTELKRVFFFFSPQHEEEDDESWCPQHGKKHTKNDHGAETREAATEYDPPAPTSSEHHSELVRKLRPKQLSTEAALDYVPNIYAFAVDQFRNAAAGKRRRAPTMAETVRHFLNRALGIRTLAVKVEEALVETCRGVQHPRLLVFSKLWADARPGSTVRGGRDDDDDDAVYQLFLEFLAALEDQLTPLTVAECMCAKGSQVEKGAVVRAVGNVLTLAAAESSSSSSSSSGERGRDESYEDVLKCIADAWSPTRGRPLTPDVEVSTSRDTLNVDTALQIVFPSIRREVRLRGKQSDAKKAAFAIQHLWRKKLARNAHVASQAHDWGLFYDRVEAELHANAPKSRSDCFEYAEFQTLIQRARQGAPVGDDLLDVIFETFHKNCEDVLLASESQVASQKSRYSRALAATILQRAWRVVGGFRKDNTLEPAEVPNDTPEATVRNGRVRVVERNFIFKMHKFRPNQRQVAVELESARGTHIARDAFCCAMIRFGFKAPPTTPTLLPSSTSQD